MDFDDKIVRDAYMMRFEILHRAHPDLEIPSWDDILTLEEYKKKYCELSTLIREQWKQTISN